MAKGMKTGGRQKGVLNKRNQLVEDIAARFKLDPFEVLMMVASGDWKGLGFEHQNKVIIGEKAGIEFSIEEPNIKLADRVQAAKEAAKYLYSQKQAVALSTGESGIKIVIEDYSKK